ncbi:MAG: cytidylate kinase [Steroidobacteraceae bacterium]|nr:cytidylate kinase [Steroidobacteraceae bacterium]
MKPPVPIVTIDGPSSSGKGTISRIVAARVGWHLLDSGALYRLVALGAALRNFDPDDVEQHVSVARTMKVQFGSVGDGQEQVLLEGQDVTRKIRTEEAGAGASRVAVWPAVRAALTDRQRAFAQPPGLVADGRDMGTVIFPDAQLKVFLTASAEERAQRRHKQLIEKGSAASLAALSREIAERDQRDMSRQVAPLKPAPDAHLLDSTGLSIEAVVERVLSLGRERGLWPKA